MNFRIWLEAISGFEPRSRGEALDRLGLKSDASATDIETAHRNSVGKHHPDKGGNPEDFQKVQSAFEYLNKSGSESPQYSHRQSQGLPPWQTDPRSTYNGIGRDFTDINYCKYKIWEKAKESGPVDKWTFQAFDGNFMRGYFAAFANQATLGYGGMVMEIWNSKGANSYDTIAVFANKEPSKTLHLVRRYGKDVSDRNITFDHGSFNSNPANDDIFMRKIRLEIPRQSSSKDLK